METPYQKVLAKALRMHLRTYSLFKTEHLNTNIGLMIYKTLIRLAMTCPTWEYAADTDLLKLQRLQNKVLLDRRAMVHKMHVAFKLYDCVTKLCRTQAEVILNHQNSIVHGIGQGEAMHRKYKRLKLGGSQAYNCSADWPSYGVVKLVKA
jgi:hypothetical protein